MRKIVIIILFSVPFFESYGQTKDELYISFGKNLQAKAYDLVYSNMIGAQGTFPVQYAKGINTVNSEIKFSWQNQAFEYDCKENRNKFHNILHLDRLSSFKLGTNYILLEGKNIVEYQNYFTGDDWKDHLDESRHFADYEAFLIDFDSSPGLKSDMRGLMNKYIK